MLVRTKAVIQAPIGACLGSPFTETEGNAAPARATLEMLVNLIRGQAPLGRFPRHIDESHGSVAHELSYRNTKALGCTKVRYAITEDLLWSCGSRSNCIGRPLLNRAIVLKQLSVAPVCGESNEGARLSRRSH